MNVWHAIHLIPLTLALGTLFPKVIGPHIRLIGRSSFLLLLWSLLNLTLYFFDQAFVWFFGQVIWGATYLLSVDKESRERLVSRYLKFFVVTSLFSTALLFPNFLMLHFSDEISSLGKFKAVLWEFVYCFHLWVLCVLLNLSFFREANLRLQKNIKGSL